MQQAKAIPEAIVRHTERAQHDSELESFHARLTCSNPSTPHPKAATDSGKPNDDHSRAKFIERGAIECRRSFSSTCRLL
jgi:hypothetical protein